jgi:hypothetical protein
MKTLRIYLLIPICDIKSRFIKEEIGEENYRVMQEIKTSNRKVYKPYVAV